MTEKAEIKLDTDDLLSTLNKLKMVKEICMELAYQDDPVVDINNMFQGVVEVMEEALPKIEALLDFFDTYEEIVPKDPDIIWAAKCAAPGKRAQVAMQT
jgi:hypothetical protein